MVGMELDDAALIGSARQGSTAALDALYRRYWPIAWQWAYALTGHRQRADDLAQDAVLSAFASLGRFVERPFRPWLKRILLNRAVDELRRLRRGALPVEWFDDRLRPTGEEELRASDELVAAVRELPPARRIVIVLHYWLDLPVDEIAALLSVPYGTAASRLSRGLAELCECLESERV
jgi:RNA polymerase sigma-70 factor (ECF subfamily)